MIVSHVPFIVSIFCSSIHCDNMYVVQSLIKSNLGPLLYDDDGISCSRIHTDLVECDVYAPFQTSCVCCQQLSDTLTPDTLSTLLNTTIYDVEIDCREPKRYSRCTVGKG